RDPLRLSLTGVGDLRPDLGRGQMQSIDCVSHDGLPRLSDQSFSIGMNQPWSTKYSRNPVSYGLIRNLGFGTGHLFIPFVSHLIPSRLSCLPPVGSVAVPVLLELHRRTGI